jgi:A/G-specific adenine glycosylase
VEVKDNVLIRKRITKDVWENLYEFVLYESDEPIEAGKDSFMPVLKKLFGKQPVVVKNISPLYRQQITHQNIAGQFIELEMDSRPVTMNDYELVKKNTLKKYPFPKFIINWLQQNSKQVQLF